MNENMILREAHPAAERLLFASEKQGPSPLSFQAVVEGFCLGQVELRAKLATVVGRLWPAIPTAFW